MPYLGGGGADGGPDPAQAAAERDRNAGGSGGKGTGHQGPVGPMGGGYGGGYFGAAKDDYDKALSRAIDRADTGNTVGEDVGNAIAGMFGIHEIGSIPQDVDKMYSGNPHLTSGQADWGLDPLSLAAGAAGAATGLPIGTGYTAARLAAQKLGLISPDWGNINLGPSIIGSPSSTPKGPVVGAGGGGGLLGALGLGGGANTGGGGGTPARGGGAGIGGSGKGGGTGTGQKPGQGTGAGNPLVNQLTQNNQNQQKPTTPTPAPAPAPTYNWQSELAALTPQLRSDFNWALGQRGLTPGTKDAFGNTINWDDAFNQELAHRIAGVPLGTTGSTDKTMLDQALNQYLLPNFGSSALDDFQTGARANARNTVGGLGLENEISNSFSPSAVQGYLDSIYGKQYSAAKQQIDNTRARGELNDLGYNAALGVLGDQGTAGKSTLSDLAGSYLTTAKGTLNDALSGIYDKIGSYTLGSGYNPNTDIANLRGQEKTLVGNLGGQITGAAPSIFDPSTIFQKASSQQGATSTGTLSDALAQRNLDQTKGRGIGSQGAF